MGLQDENRESFDNALAKANEIERKRKKFLPSANPIPTPLSKRTAVEMREAASERLDLAIAAVEAILRDSEARHSDKLAAATFIRDTAHGKPAQTMETTINATIKNDDTLYGLTNEQRAHMYEEEARLLRKQTVLTIENQ